MLTTYTQLILKLFMGFTIGVHSVHRVDFGLDVSGRFEIRFCVHIVFYPIVIILEVGSLGFGYKIR